MHPATSSSRPPTPSGLVDRVPAPATAPAPAPGGWYRLKPAWQRRLQPVSAALIAAGVSADAVSLAALPVAAAGGLCLAFSTSLPALLAAVPLLAASRLALNVLDGQVARGAGTSRPMGEVANELGDRVADLLFLGGLAFVAGVGPAPAGAAIAMALLASFAGVLARAVGAPRQYGGIMSKPARMLVLAIAAPAALLAGGGGPLAAGAWVIAVGGAITVAQRVRATARWTSDARP